MVCQYDAMLMVKTHMVVSWNRETPPVIIHSLDGILHDKPSSDKGAPLFSETININQTPQMGGIPQWMAYNGNSH